MRFRSALARHPAIVSLAALFLVTEAVVLIFGALPEVVTPPIRVGRYDPYPAVYADFENRLRAKGIQFVLLPRDGGRYNQPVRDGVVDVLLPLPSEFLTYDADSQVSATAAAKIAGLIDQYNVDLAQGLLASQGQAQATRGWSPVRAASDPSFGRTLPVHLFLAVFLPAILLIAIVLGAVTAPPTLLARIRRGGLFAVALLIELMIVTVGLEIAGRDGAVYEVSMGYYVLTPYVVLAIGFVLIVALPAALSFAVALGFPRRLSALAIACIAGVAAFTMFAAVLDAQTDALPIARVPIAVSAVVLAGSAGASIVLWRFRRLAPATA